MQRVGDIPLMKRLAREAKAAVITPAKQKLLDAAVSIHQDPNDAEAAFMARQLVQCTCHIRTPATSLLGRVETAILPLPSSPAPLSRENPSVSLRHDSPAAAVLDEHGSGENEKPPS
jgi:hypothetical protein